MVKNVAGDTEDEEPGSVTRELRALHSGGEMSGRLYDFVRGHFKTLLGMQAARLNTVLIDDEDLLQELILQLCTHPHAVRSTCRQNFRVDFARLVRFRSVDMYRHNATHKCGGRLNQRPLEAAKELSDDGCSAASSQLIAKEILQYCDHELSFLRGNEKLAVMCFVKGMSIQEIRATLQKTACTTLRSEQTIRRWIMRFTTRIKNRFPDF